MDVGFCSSADFIRHRTGAAHPERPDRIRAIAKAVRAAQLVRSPDPFPQFELDLQLQPAGGLPFIEIAPRSATVDQILLAHSPRTVEFVRHICQSGGGVLDSGDTPVGAESFDIALLACGSALACADAVMSGQARRAFAAIRPPGHHAEPDHPMGFCLFNNIAIAARYLQKNHGLEKLAIVDFDVHHGNGTQAVFQSDPSVLFISLHQHPSTCYPGTGHAWETGDGPGEGATLNIPLNPGGGDEEYLQAMQSAVLPKLEEFHPQLLLISAGFDAHREDPLAQMNVSEAGFAQMSSLLVRFADRCCDGRVVSLLEGGYNLRALGRSVVQHLLALRG